MQLNALKIDYQTLEKLVDDLCYIKDNTHISKQQKKLQDLNNLLKIDDNKLEAAYYYQQLDQKEWVNNLAEFTKQVLSNKTITIPRGQILNQQIIQAISLVGKIYETGDEKLIEKLRQLIDVKREKIKQKMTVVNQKLKQLTKPQQDIAMQRGYGDVSTRDETITKDEKGFTKPYERKRELKSNPPQQSNKRAMLEQNPQKEKDNETGNPQTFDRSNK